MRLRWLLALLIAPALVFGTTPANAANSIRSTKEFRALQTYVSQLEVKKGQPQTAAQIAQYRSELSTRKARVSNKVRALYQQDLKVAKERKSLRQEKVQALKAKKRQTLSTLRKAEQGRLNAIAANRRAELARINTNYTTQLDKLTKQRAKLQA